MTKKVTITLKEEVLAFLDQQVKNGNGLSRSGFINAVLERERKDLLERELEHAYQRDAADPQYRSECGLWDSVVGDGLSA